MNERALIFNIQRFSLHDGPGIRTTVFFKGCPLWCKWCSNPESQGFEPELMVYPNKCIRCQKCIQVCPREAVTLTSNGVKVVRAKCDNCLKCIAVCPAGALVAIGQFMLIEDLVSEVERDALFYRNSGGGITASGGEPLAQWHFLHKFFEECKQKGFSTALDTCGYAPEEALKQVLKYTDLVLFDIKHMDSRTHRKFTGKGNELILTNAEFAASKVTTWLRVPLFSGINDSKDNLQKVGQFGAKIGVEKISVLPYHTWGTSKYPRLGRRYPVAKADPPNKEDIEAAKLLLEKYVSKVTVNW